MCQFRIRLKPNLTRSLFLGALLSLHVGCSSDFQTSHEPMHPVYGYVTLKASATGLIDRIELRMKRSSIDPFNGNETAETPLLLVEVCDPVLATKALTCTYEAAWSGHGKMIEFEGKAVLWNGTVRTETYRFASGIYPLAGSPIPIRVNLDPIEALDVVIVPDPDLLNPIYAYPWSGFRNFLDDLIDGVFFDYSAIREWRGLYNFYYSPETGEFNEQNCDFDYGDAVNDIDVLGVIADTLIYVHAREMWDCTLGTGFSTEIWYDKSAIHEIGHALIGLRDEYNVQNVGDYGPQDTMGNTFDGKAACELAAPDIGLPETYCTIATPAYDIWRIDPTGPLGCIMGPSQHVAWSDFGPACQRRINWRYGKCLDGDCMSLADLDAL